MSADRTRRRARRKPGALLDLDWAALRALLPPDLEASARAHGAFARAREVRDATTVLRLALVYVTALPAFADVAAWAVAALGLAVTDGAIRYRVTAAAAWLEHLVGATLARSLPAAAALPARRLRILDATYAARPGATAMDWVLHVTYDVLAGAMVGVELTTSAGGEHLRRAVARAGDLVLGDRGYGRVADLRAAYDGGFDALLRVHLPNLIVHDARGVRWTPAALMAAADRGDCDHAVTLTQKGDTVAARLVLVALPREAADRARHKVHKAAAARRKSADPTTLALAGYVVLVTTLAPTVATPAQLLRCYRVRWQVELFFKRAKSLLGLATLTDARDDGARVQLWGRLLYATLVARAAVARELVHAPADIVAATAPPVSLWKVTRLVARALVAALLAPTTTRRARADAIRARLRERPRRKRDWVRQHLTAWDALQEAANPAQTAA